MSKLALTFLLFATAAWSQAPPASVYSLGGSHMGPPRASVYSAPTMSQHCCGSGGASVFFGGSFGHNPRFNVGIGGPRFGARRFPFSSRRQGFRRHGFRGQGFGGQGVFPVYVPYYGYGYDYSVEAGGPYDETGPGTYERPSDSAARRYYGEADASRSRFDEPPARSEEDDRYGEHYLDSREATRRPAAPPPEMPSGGVTTANGSDDGTPTVLVFRDGHESEIGNYVIMGSTIFVLSGERTKIPLSQVDVPKTQAANYQRGIDFHVPPTK